VVSKVFAASLTREEARDSRFQTRRHGFGAFTSPRFPRPSRALVLATSLSFLSAPRLRRFDRPGARLPGEHIGGELLLRDQRAVVPIEPGLERLNVGGARVAERERENMTIGVRAPGELRCGLRARQHETGRPTRTVCDAPAATLKIGGETMSSWLGARTSLPSCCDRGISSACTSTGWSPAFSSTSEVEFAPAGTVSRTGVAVGAGSRRLSRGIRP
jgi:hypothetical protein